MKNIGVGKALPSLKPIRQGASLLGTYDIFAMGVQGIIPCRGVGQSPK